MTSPFSLCEWRPTSAANAPVTACRILCQLLPSKSCLLPPYLLRYIKAGAYNITSGTAMNKNLPKPISKLQCDPHTTFNYICTLTPVVE